MPYWVTDVGLMLTCSMSVWFAVLGQDRKGLTKRNLMDSTVFHCNSLFGARAFYCHVQGSCGFIGFSTRFSETEKPLFLSLVVKLSEILSGIDMKRVRIRLTMGSQTKVWKMSWRIQCIALHSTNGGICEVLGESLVRVSRYTLPRTRMSVW